MNPHFDPDAFKKSFFGAVIFSLIATSTATSREMPEHQQPNWGTLPATSSPIPSAVFNESTLQTILSMFPKSILNKRATVQIDRQLPRLLTLYERTYGPLAILDLSWLDWLNLQMEQRFKTTMREIFSVMETLDEESQRILNPLRYFGRLPLENAWYMICGRFLNPESDYKGYIHIRLEYTEGLEFIYRVSDNGTGMAKWTLAKLFSPPESLISVTDHGIFFDYGGHDQVAYRLLLHSTGASELVIVSHHMGETWRMRATPTTSSHPALERLTGVLERPHQGTDMLLRIPLPPSPEQSARRRFGKASA